MGLKMAKWSAWLTIIGGIFAIAGFWMPLKIISTFGGILALIGGIGVLSSK